MAMPEIDVSWRRLRKSMKNGRLRIEWCVWGLWYWRAPSGVSV